MLDRAGLDSREINRRAVKYWPTIYNMLVTWHGLPLGEVQRLGNPNLVIDPNKRRPNGPRLIELRGPSPVNFSWHCLGNGAKGDDVIDLVAYLGECDRRTAAEFLRDLTDRFVEIAA